MKPENKKLQAFTAAGILLATLCATSTGAQKSGMSQLKVAAPNKSVQRAASAPSSVLSKNSTPKRAPVAEPTGDPLWAKKFQDIQSIENPTDWKIKPLVVTPEGLEQHFVPPADRGNNIDYWVREIRATPDKVTDSERAARKQIFQSAERDLTEAEKQSIPELLKAYNSKSASPRSIRKCKVTPFHGKKCLFITATLPVDEENDYVGGMIIDTLVDASGDGSRIVQFDYAAEIDVFEHYAKDVGKSIDSVKFK